jgi:diguanylate cyclase (GGDEF)-like protein/PAS domain S-box-containing protein
LDAPFDGGLCDSGDIPVVEAPAGHELLDSALDGAMLLDREWRITYLNRRARERMARGIPLLGQVLWDRFPILLGTSVEENYYRVMQQRVEATFEAAFAPQSAWFEIHAWPLLDGGIGVWFRDIKERKQTETALASVEERFRMAAGATLDLIYDWDIAGGKIQWNEALNEGFGYRNEDLGTEHGWWLDHIHPGDRHRVAQKLEHALRSGSSRCSAEYRFLKADGSYADVCDRGFVIRDQQGRPVRMVGAMQDNTQRNDALRTLREREADLSAVCKHATIGILHRALDGTLLMVNDRFCQILGRSEDEIGTLAIADYTHPDDLVWNNTDRYGRIARGEALQVEKRYVRPDGSIVWCDVNVSRVEATEQRPGSVIVVAQDITQRRAAEDALRRSEERLRLIQEATELADFESGPDAISTCSDRFFEQAGLPVGDHTIAFPEFLRLIHPDDRSRLDGEINQALSKGDLFSSEFRIRRADTGEERWISCRTKMIRDHAGVHVKTIGAHLDITDRKRGEEALRESEERFRLAAEAAGLGVWDYDEAANRRDWSGRLKEILGVPADAHPSIELALTCVHSDDRDEFKRHLSNLLKGRGSDRFEASFRICRPNDSQPRWVALSGWKTLAAAPGKSRVIVTARDITDEKTAEERVLWSATHDGLTGLANRSLFQQKLEDAIHTAARSGASLGLLMLDMDHFKQINDTLGHDAGDMLLKMFAERLQGAVRASDTVARFGGDEFAVVLPALRDEQSLADTLEAILERLREPFAYAGRILDCRASIGASSYPLHGETAEVLLKNADMALYEAKAAGRATGALFEPRMRSEAQRRGTMVQRARDAVADDRVVPYYQPKLDLSDGTVVGFEALLRWRDANGRVHLPQSIRAAFEDLDVAATISDRMVHHAIADMRAWLDRGVAFDHVAVNASAAEFRRDNFAERVLEGLAQAEVPTRHFQLEVTETVFLGRGAEYVHRALGLLSTNGVKIALDDFGTGYASLRHLKQFPVDIIKIDQSFVRDMEEDAGDEAIIRAVINLARSLSIKVVAEGIETRSQADRLVELECDFGQGFLYSKAVPASRVPSLMGRWRSEWPPCPAAAAA